MAFDQRIQKPQLFALTWLTFQQIDLMTNQIKLLLAADGTTILYLGKALGILDKEIREVS